KSVVGNDEVCVTDLEGHVRVLNRSWPFVFGVAWAPGDSEIWFTSGRTGGKRNFLVATDLAGNSREVYRSVSSIRLDDIAPDGRVLVSTQLDRADALFLDFERRTHAFLSWTKLQRLAAFSADGKLLMSIEADARFDVSVAEPDSTSPRTVQA